MQIEQMRQHRDGDDGQGEGCRNPESASNVAQLAIIFRIGGQQWFQRHAADRAGARADLPDLGWQQECAFSLCDFW